MCSAKCMHACVGIDSIKVTRVYCVSYVYCNESFTPIVFMWPISRTFPSVFWNQQVQQHGQVCCSEISAIRWSICTCCTTVQKFHDSKQDGLRDMLCIQRLENN